MIMNCCLQFNPLIGSFFRTETAVLRVVTDILAALDRGQISLSGMFDLSAAFDTLNHSILLKRLEIGFWDTGRCARKVLIILDWEKSAGVCSYCYGYVCVS